MTEPQGAIVARDDVGIWLRLWWNGKEKQPSVVLSREAALNLLIDLGLALRREK